MTIPPFFIHGPVCPGNFAIGALILGVWCIQLEAFITTFPEKPGLNMQGSDISGYPSPY